ncbi:hypothetical protein WS67_12545 [Burkholderia singularis]|uniref:Uncharacterized protein n=1 Tax=Burkholderia singularis TaxID=1503053 RepID=A0A103E2U3_9BURK|nr:hypothetical protein WS67_12545 [Burkholderia singularis]
MSLGMNERVTSMRGVRATDMCVTLLRGLSNHARPAFKMCRLDMYPVTRMHLDILCVQPDTGGAEVKRNIARFAVSLQNREYPTSSRHPVKMNQIVRFRFHQATDCYRGPYPLTGFDNDPPSVVRKIYYVTNRHPADRIGRALMPK